MEGGYKCGICSKSFPNQQALGGHMRSHFAFLPISPKSKTSGDSKSQRKSYQPSTSGLADKRCMKRGTLIDNPNRSSQLVIDQNNSTDFQRSEFSRVPMPTKEPTDLLSDEDVARFLVDLSKGEIPDARKKKDKGKRKLEEYGGGSGDGEKRKHYDEDRESSNQDKGGNATTMYQSLISPSNSPSDIPSSSIHAEPIECKKQLPDLNLPPPDEDDEII